MASHLLLPNLGLTCTEQNFITKAGAQRTASELGVLIVAPDTSPRKFTIYKFDNEIDVDVVKDVEHFRVMNIGQR